MTQPRVKRRYDSAVRREHAARTRESIVAAGAELVHGYSSWDWRQLTVRAVAERSGVHERTVYRHFVSEQHLRAAVLARLQEEAGITVEDVTLDRLPDQVGRLFRYLGSFASSTEPALDASLADLDGRRKAAVLSEVAAKTPGWTDEQRAVAAALVDVLWSVPTYRRLVTGWGIDADRAAGGVTWAIGLIVDALAGDHPPTT